MHRPQPLKTLNKLVFYTSLILLLTSCWQRNDFPDDMAIMPALLEAPVQRLVSEEPFTVTNHETNYRSDLTNNRGLSPRICTITRYRASPAFR
jgi:hypothetical protein